MWMIPAEPPGDTIRVMHSVPAPALKAMVPLPGGTFAMGSGEFYAEEAPVHEGTGGAFAIDRHPVTVAEFRRFVTETGYLSDAERELGPRRYPAADRALLVPGSLV